MNFSIVIPARYASTRFPGKPLVLLNGKTMLERVYTQCKQVGALQVVIATDDQRIFDHATGFCDHVIMTSDQHVSGTDRLQECAQLIGLDDNHILVNVQGDEPFIAKENISQVAQLLQNLPECGMATLYENIVKLEDFLNPNVVKVVCEHNQAQYFSRACIPFDRDAFLNGVQSLPAMGAKRHIGIYAYRKQALDLFVSFNQSNHEKTESLEQLRFLDNQIGIAIDLAKKASMPGIDTPDDVKWALDYLKNEKGD
ncbi:3-deoxy-manno-octulosonate cytidylyltransferase [Marinicellulosiphila megalodicopiae]|uniref:3-deoxy-manno-octulosonate cytidylyltransferase n=1 Tax=Marinicellulosiphila megalodicopiae TaxID=2724896 RepID=UPI003BAF7C10